MKIETKEGKLIYATTDWNKDGTVKNYYNIEFGDEIIKTARVDKKLYPYFEKNFGNTVKLFYLRHGNDISIIAVKQEDNKIYAHYRQVGNSAVVLSVLLIPAIIGIPLLYFFKKESRMIKDLEAILQAENCRIINVAE